jgi:hypothetical protein
MGNNSSLFVYYDVERASNWIEPEISKVIHNVLKSVTFQPINADELRKVMLSVIKGETKKTVVVFAQDVAPDTVLNEQDPPTLIRQYLDNGGSIVWIGDIPFYYKSGIRQKIDISKTRALANILAINTISAMQIAKAKITKCGKRIGIETSWTGVRPVLIDNSITVLAKSRCSLGISYYPLPPNRWWKRLTNVNLGVGQASFGITVENPKSNEDSEFPSKNTLVSRIKTLMRKILLLVFLGFGIITHMKYQIMKYMSYIRLLSLSLTEQYWKKTSSTPQSKITKSLVISV